MNLFAVGVNHTTADVELREQLAFSADQADQVLAVLRDELPGVREAALLSTCNRTELYCLVDGPIPDFSDWLARARRMPSQRLRDVVYQYRDEQALEHMMRVAGGLDSLVLGEPQILGQMREAYARAHEAGLLNSDLGRVFQDVFSVAKRIRTETGIGANPVSVAYAAVSFARHIFSDLKKSRALLVGAGEMIQLVARHLHEQQVREIVIANRTLDRASELAAEVAGRAIGLEELPVALEHADIVISCTASPLPVLGKGTVERALKRRRHRPMFMVDIAVPRDIEPEVGKLDDVYLYTVDHLQEAIEENVRARQEAAREAGELIREAVHRHRRSRREQRAAGVLRDYRQQRVALADQELERALSQLRNGADPEDVLRRFKHNLVNKWLHQPSVSLRRMAAEGRVEDLRTARELLLGDEPDQT
ncbi:glutamyl-tRNA reductase [Alloalcanivorax xenomutans]|jgi:glutamyl-tRNA reductase|uniref:glutamyl-tRNA reductase n=1 Tax=Alloalcanivorax xenomutans TaxID=1094342 RepID=UPI00047B7412|nr:glutamyl-tRNA reductase [Alloalcanivorax xenomutans]MBA4723295.1 glutamyl-tRNA reductase [Alcanivorax sp.]MCE7525723.1 glutamyl-tRNA reductase [Alloalcanivorax xenomutans]PHS59000.1 MAG: glutamyl-tRNA reductase [Alcanivorax sp.]WOA30665.1 glutamyl-tRNA reductase [Alloalcanivorax xenomutans]WOD27543.1 glutamyl-tRNA reductase [Alloalcanivorax xenomutans]|tara:strand:- start:819 stop:2084 length:1266 start_codon:yes stop_codon:yes gene_type:complete